MEKNGYPKFRFSSTLNDIQVGQVINQIPQEVTFNNAFDTYVAVVNQTVALINT